MEKAAISPPALALYLFVKLWTSWRCTSCAWLDGKGLQRPLTQVLSTKPCRKRSVAELTPVGRPRRGERSEYSLSNSEPRLREIAQRAIRACQSSTGLSRQSRAGAIPNPHSPCEHGSNREFLGGYPGKQGNAGWLTPSANPPCMSKTPVSSHEQRVSKGGSGAGFRNAWRKTFAVRETAPAVGR